MNRSLVFALLAGAAASAPGANLLLNHGFEEPLTNAVPASNWWYYAAAGRADWAARPPSAWGNSFYPAGNVSGGFGQDVPVALHRGGVFVFAVSAKAETNYTNANTTMALEFYSGGSLQYVVTSNVYAELDSRRKEWVYFELVHTNSDPSVDHVQVRCDFADCTIPGGATLATCQWDEPRLYQAPVHTASVPRLEKHEPLSGVYLGVLLERGGSSNEIVEFNAKANKSHAVYAKFLLFRQDPFPWDWVRMIQSIAPGAGIHFILEPMIGFTNFYAAEWGPGQETYEAAREFVTNCAAVGTPVFLRFAHEANGDWYPWHPQFSERYHIPDDVSNETYIAGYRNFANLVHAQAPNVAMVWAPNQGNGPYPMPFYEDTYPGDAYVDWVGMSVYNGWSYGNSNEVRDFQFRTAIQKGYWQENDDSYDDTFENFYWLFSDPDNPVGHHKPMMIAETAAAFEPKYFVTNQIVIAGFESLDGPQFSASNLLCQFQSLNSDGLETSNEQLLEGFEEPAYWNWLWGDLYFSNSSDRVEGTNAVRLGAKAEFVSGTYVGGDGRTVAATNLTSFDGVVLDVRREESAEPDPLLVIGLRCDGATATVSRVVVGTEFYPLKIRFDEFTPSGPFSLSHVNAITLELISTVTNSRPADVWVDNWRTAAISDAPFIDPDWWPAGTNDVPWTDDTDTSGGWMTWQIVQDESGGYPTNSVKLSGLDANSNHYVGGNGFSLAPEDRDWSACTFLSIVARRGDFTNAEPLLSISLRDASNVRTARISTVVVPTNYLRMQVPFADMTVNPGFDWTNVAAVVFELLSGRPGEQQSDLYVKEFSIGTASNTTEQDWWTAGTGFQPWGDTSWTQSADAAVGQHSLQISGLITNGDQWYIGGNGCAIPIARQDWSSSSALVLYGKKGAVTNYVQPRFKITLDNDYAETNGNEAIVETKVANTNWYEMIMPFEDFLTDQGFAWTNIKMVKIELFTGEGGKQQNDLFLDHLQRASVTLTNGADNIKWKHDWCNQLYSLENYQDGDPADPDANPDFVSIVEHFRNVHMINWFHVKKFEDGFTKDLKIAEDATNGVVYASYYERIRDPYFLTRVVTDADGDGIHDTWEMDHFGGVTNADAGSDDDEDGMSNYAEFLAGTDPGEIDSAFAMSAHGVVQTAFTNGFLVQWASESNRVYALDGSTNLQVRFTAREERIFATPPMNSYTVVVDAVGPCFYRVRLTP